MSFSAPKAPDPVATSQAQQQYNIQAAQEQQKQNEINQGNQYGTINYIPDSSSPSGYRLQTSLSPEQKNLYDQFTNTQGVFGASAPGLVQNAANFYGQTPNIDGSAVTKQLNNWQQQYLQPIFNQQSSNVEAQLRDQGLTPGSEAYNNAKNLLARNQGDVTNQYLGQNQAQGYQQALQNYQLQQQNAGAQAQLGETMFGASAPQGPTQLQTPTAQIQPANYQGAVQSNYDQQMKNYENTWNNVGKLGTAGVGLAMAPMSGGTSLAGMFAKGLTGGWGS